MPDVSESRLTRQPRPGWPVEEPPQPGLGNALDRQPGELSPLFEQLDETWVRREAADRYHRANADGVGTLPDPEDHERWDADLAAGAGVRRRRALAQLDLERAPDQGLATKERVDRALLADHAQSTFGGRQAIAAAARSFVHVTIGAVNAGLCDSCRHQKMIESGRGSRFSMCLRWKTDGRFPKYPRLPVRRCSGYERRSTGL